MRIPLLLIAASLALCAKAEQRPLPRVYQYRIYLRDKNESPYNLRHPERFLSAKSLERRRRQDLEVDSTDLPVTPNYIKAIEKTGLRIMATSRWHNTVWVESSTDDVAEKVGHLPFVSRVLRTYVSPDSIPSSVRSTVDDTITKAPPSDDTYGKAQWQIQLINGNKLHGAGFRGSGMTIVILDAGFHNTDRIPALSGTNIIATHDLAPRRTDDIYSEHSHGTMVLSTMAMNKDGVMVGTAPEASYVLIRTEDNDTETRAEEDSWTAGVEYADSIGADLINSSLGYYHWDGDSIGPHLRDLDGRTAFISQTASLLSKKGIVLCNSAGNEGFSTWHKISVPADAPGILTVGAVSKDSTIAMFSSLGPSQDGRVKPDVCAPGAFVYVVDGSGQLAMKSGTSFASPILCGLVACLWQSMPQLTAEEIMEKVRQSADRTKWPDNVYGYGLPDFGAIR